ncbi:hypothetical protein AB205_0196020 [Aquarana catesbeiana]|uniref:START domain-containing protein n=1 Tax=Aquarana catesbeiana TaxID=8400 RepID=A0A2G9S9A2_AQUCT|nr:hypothetical protein AB205_0196020 [Aquarana catesbeiana]
MTFMVLDENNHHCILPRIKPEPGDGERRYREAYARRKIRLDRKYVISCKQSEVPLSVPWDPSNQVQLYTLEDSAFLSFKLDIMVTVNAKQTFNLLSDLCRRKQWDPFYKECQLLQQVNEDDAIYHVISTVPSAEGKPQDYILLASRRLPCTTGDPYVVAFRSVSLPTHPPINEYSRGESLCSGFCIWSEGDKTKVSYYNQFTPGLVSQVTTNIAGLSSDFASTYQACERFLVENTKDSAGDVNTPEP